MKKILTCLAFLLLFISLTLAYPPNIVRAENCPQNCGSGTNFCGCGTQPTVTCTDAACTLNCITSCSTTIDCTIGDGTLKDDAYCGQFGASCPASTSTRQFFDTTVTCDTGSGNCKSTCPYFSCSVDSASATGSTTGTASVKFTGTARDDYDRIDWSYTDPSNTTTKAGTNNPDASGNGSASLTGLAANTSYKVTAVYWTSALTRPAITCSGSPSFLTYPAVITSPAADCPSPGTSATISFGSSPSGADKYNLRVNDNNDSDGGTFSPINYPTNPAGDFAINNASQSLNYPNFLAGHGYNWWVDACNSAGCTPGNGKNFLCTAPSTSISAQPASLPKTTSWLQLTLSISTNDPTASRVMICQVTPTETCTGNTGWTDITSSLNPTTLTKDGTSSNYTFNPPATYSAGDYYFAVFPSGTPRLATSNKVTFILSLLSVSCSVDKTTANINTNVTWTASPAGGTSPYTYAWSGTDALNGKTGNPVTLQYTSKGSKTGSVTVTDSAGTSVGPTDCTNSVLITAPDLQVEPLSPVFVEVNTAVSISPIPTVKNYGDGTTGVSSTTRLQIDTNKDGTYDSLGANGDKTTGILSANGTANHTWSAVWTPTATNTYNYKVTADATKVVTESDETNNDKVSTITVNPAATTLPGAFNLDTPTDGCSSGSPYVDLNWGASSGANYYYVLRGTSNITPQKIYQLIYRDTTVSLSTGYTYQIQAVNSRGTTKSDSKSITVRSSCPTATSPAPSPSPSPSPSASPASSPSPSPSPTALPLPVVSTALTCIAAGYNGSGFTVAWTNSGVTWVDIDDIDALFTEPFYHKDPKGLTVTSAPAGFGAFGSGAASIPANLTFNPSTTYHTRTFNGTVHSLVRTFKTVPACTSGSPAASASPAASGSPAPGPSCGDGLCLTGTETSSSCPQDCGPAPSPSPSPAPAPVCGNGSCETSETTASCPTDCPGPAGPVCPNNICERGETCPADCPSGGPVCGNQKCEGAEPVTCKKDCPGVILPWIQTTGGDVHSNVKINTPGGP